MPTTVRNLTPAFLAFWEQAEGKPDDQRLTLMTAYAGANPEVVSDVTRDGGRPDLEQALRQYPELLERIRANAQPAVRWVEEAAALVAPVLDAEDFEVPSVVMVGLARSNGWVTEVDGRHTLFLAVEQIADARAGRILATHEIGHAFQLPLPDEQWPEDGPLGQGIYAEGFATALTAELMPEYSLAEHLWFGPGYDDWLTDCERVLPAARAAVLAELDSADEAVLSRYLSLGTSDMFPTRIGYLVGTRVVQELRRKYSWSELARWSTERAMTEVRAVLGGQP